MEMPSNYERPAKKARSSGSTIVVEDGGGCNNDGNKKSNDHKIISVVATTTQNSRNTVKNADPLEFLTDDLWIQVLSFVGNKVRPPRNDDNNNDDDDDNNRVPGTPVLADDSEESQGEDNEVNNGQQEEESSNAERRRWDGVMNIRQAFLLYLQPYASVSRRWRTTMDRCISKIVKLEIDFRDVDEEMSHALTEWICIHKFRIHAMHVGSDKDQRFVGLATRIIQECDTSNLFSVVCRLSLYETSKFNLQRSFHDALAKEECPKLRHLAIALGVGEFDYNTVAEELLFSQNLTSHPGITHMKIKVFVDSNANGIRDGRFLCNLTKNLPNLESLQLECDEDEIQLLGSDDTMVIQVSSPSIEILRTDDFCGRKAHFDLRCPSLKFFGFCGGLYPRGPPNNRDLSPFLQQRVVAGKETIPADCMGLMVCIPGLPPLPLPFHPVLMGTEWDELPDHFFARSEVAGNDAV